LEAEITQLLDTQDTVASFADYAKRYEEAKKLCFDWKRLAQRREESEVEIDRRVEEGVLQKAKDIEKERVQLQTREADCANTEAKVDQWNREREDFVAMGGPRFLELINEQRPDASLERVEKLKAPLALESLWKEYTGRLSRLGHEFSDQERTQEAQVLLSCLTAAVEGMFVVLAGSTGVGKTSLISKTAFALGSGCAVVPVRPGWIDPGDLTGFFDPQQMCFRPTAFMTRLRQSGEYSLRDRFYFLLLDEMNLSRIENYAADFLSRLEKARSKEEDGRLLLYSEENYAQAKSRWTKLTSSTSSADQELTARGEAIEAYLRLEQLDSYPPSFTIPEGLIFCGTINPDETTYQLSPKFLDRSFTFKITRPEGALSFPHGRRRVNGQLDGVGLECSTLIKVLKSSRPLQCEPQLIQDLNNWCADLGQLGCYIGFRTMSALRTWMTLASAIGFESHLAADLFSCSKLLSRISFQRDQKAEPLRNQNEERSREAKLDILKRVSDVVASSRFYPRFASELQRLASSEAAYISYLEQ
jgi:hypothetical protein